MCVYPILYVRGVSYKNSRRVNAFSTCRPPPQFLFLYSCVYVNRVAFFINSYALQKVHLAVFLLD